MKIVIVKQEPNQPRPYNLQNLDEKPNKKAIRWIKDIYPSFNYDSEDKERPVCQHR